LSIKNYDKTGGLSKYIFRYYNKEGGAFNARYQVKGPLGPGIDIKKRGKHVAITAGTGVLVFMDLVAYLLLRLIERAGGPQILGVEKESGETAAGDTSAADNSISKDSITEEEPEEDIKTIDIDNFSFVLHTSFATKDEAIGLELIE